MNERANRVADLFKQEVPEIANGLIQIKEIARKPGIRAKVALQSTNNDLDCVAVCVGNRGERIKKVVNSLNEEGHGHPDGTMEFERVDIFEWSENLDVLIRRSLQPFPIQQIMINTDRTEATVNLAEKLPTLSAGNLADHVELASEICHCAIAVE
jgi:N utilization substance protein A